MEEKNKSKIIIYGAGRKGRNIYNFLCRLGYAYLVYAFCDRNAVQLGKIDNIPVIDIDEAKKTSLSFLIGVGGDYVDEVRELLAQEKVYHNLEEYCVKCLDMSRVEYNREYCAFFHIGHMDSYYKVAETDEALKFFWGDGICRDMFMKMNHEKIIELACGRGRHVPQYINLAKKVILVDILKKNIEECRDRFKNYKNISYYVNNGYDLSELPENSFTAIFTYDAMVHFELMDIASYLQECARVLEKGGMGLFHHSNNCSDYKATFANAPHGRSYMSKNLFAYLAHRAGLEIVHQEIVDWGGVENLDCISLVRK
ncbi:class I SAM-dependent methyltransferase [Selenomonas sp. FC4001]|uniref:class I SAM-dependent methyltransferase n=1 Tax=Selenomonas sp. FC4001 TaxID=1408313 RepID=UPI00069218FA|nr:class I SAM-dependent methyltransferase [Selenomonas sp. FC4001]